MGETGKTQQGYPSGPCPASPARFRVAGATPALLSSKRAAEKSFSSSSSSSSGEERAPLSAGARVHSCPSGSRGIGRFLKGSFEEQESAGRLRVPLLSEPGSARLGEQRVSVPVHAGGAGEPRVPRASLAHKLQSGVPVRPRALVLRSSGAVATDWWSPFMVMILGINRTGFRGQQRATGSEEIKAGSGEPIVPNCA